MLVLSSDISFIQMNMFLFDGAAASLRTADVRFSSHILSGDEQGETSAVCRLACSRRSDSDSSAK